MRLAKAVVLAGHPHTVIIGCDGIPSTAGILQHRLHKCLVCCIFQPLVGGLDAAPEEAQVLLALLQTSVILLI